MISGSMVGRSPCTLTTTSTCAFGIEALQRLEDAVGAGFVVGPRHHRLEAMRAHRFEHARRIGRHDDAAERRFRWRGAATWTIIGRPPMSASGLPGSRVEAMRAGMRIRAVIEAAKSDGKAERPKVAKRLTGSALIGVATS